MRPVRCQFLVLMTTYILLVFACIQCYSQDTDEPVKIRFDLPPNADRLQGDRTRIFTVKGSPYLNEKFRKGTIINGTTTTEALLRYNAYFDSFQMLNGNSEKVFVFKAPSIKITLDNKTYILDSYEITTQDKALYYLPETFNKELNGNKINGYFRILNEGETLLYLKTSKRVPKFSLPDHGYEQFSPTSLTKINNYYIKRKNRPATRIKLSKKEVLYALNDKYNEIRTYIKKNKLKVKSEEEVIEILKYYDSLN